VYASTHTHLWTNSLDTQYLDLTVNPAQPPEAQISSAVDALLAQHDRSDHGPTLSVRPDALVKLEARTIGALIAALRRLREVGGRLEIATGRTDVRETLRITGLDHVFTIDALTEEPKTKRRGGVGSLKAAAIAALIGVFSLVSPAFAQTIEPAAALEPAAIIAMVVEKNPSLASYQSRVHVDVHIRKGLSIFTPLANLAAPKLDGKTYFKRPNNYEVVFESVPSYAKGFEKMYTDIGDPSNWEKRFAISVIGERLVNGHTDIELKLVQRVRGMIDHENVLVDPSAWQIDAMEYHYYNGGTVVMTQKFRDEGPFSVLASQTATIDIPHISATAFASYTDYHTNVAVDDSLFTKAH
jgi:hypothetical protein